MIVHQIEQVIGTDREVDWGNGTSSRLLVAADGRGFAMTDTYVRPGTKTLLRYDNHLEACYCIEGSGRLETSSDAYDLVPGTMYAPDKGEEHRLIAGDAGLRLICVFNPPLTGNENHRHVPGQPSGY
jgi:L-ectoine synthase